MVQCCIFDLDGTLLNSIYALQESVNRTLAHFGLEPITEEDTKTFVGDGYKKLIERALHHRNDSDPEHYEEGIRLYQEIFKEYCLYRVEPYDGIPELLRFLKEQGIRTAVLSNKPHERTADNIRGTLGMEQFDRVYGEREAQGIPKKPSPEGLWKILEELQIEKENCLYLGDTNTDMITAGAAGVAAVGAAWGFRSREELEAFSPCLVADTPWQVIDYIKGVNRIE